MFIPKTFESINVIYDYRNNSLVSKDTRFEIAATNGTHRNFPIGTFFDEKRYMVYIVYR